ncbi:hypothetical protein [Ralstonia solanacearum]|uniref:hypothetical protein n=1 Tax=Ralstonia solanacearum TaxID=305 RepID=UPI0018D08CA1|nr:hypothetical protein [Ralstonia solanacearum]
MRQQSSSSNVDYSSNRIQNILRSKHAKKRCQQRAISDACIPVIEDFGDAEYDGRGAIRITMTKQAMRRLYQAYGRTQQFERLENIYIVISARDHTVITTGHSYV